MRFTGSHLVNRSIIITSGSKVRTLSFRDEERDFLIRSLLAQDSIWSEHPGQTDRRNAGWNFNWNAVCGGSRQLTTERIRQYANLKTIFHVMRRSMAYVSNLDSYRWSMSHLKIFYYGLLKNDVGPLPHIPEKCQEKSEYSYKCIKYNLKKFCYWPFVWHVAAFPFFFV